jgi:plastocyanin
VSRLRYPLVALAAVSALAAGIGGTQATAGTTKVTKLYGQTGPGYAIKLTNYSFVRIKHLKPGVYTFVIQDRSTIHNFHLVGPGVNKSTPVRYLGTKTWTKLRLKKGTYRYFCNPHKGQMKGSFTVK